jgi:hypothetical protein
LDKDDRQSKTIRELLEREPFIPFEIVMNSGDRIKIEAPGLVTFQDAWLIYMLPRSNSFVQLRMNQLSFIQINDLWHQ